MPNKSLAVVLAVLCIVFIVATSGAIEYYVPLTNSQNNQIKSLQTSLSGNETALASANSQIGTLQSQLNSAIESKDALSNQLSSANSEITSLQGQLSSESSQISSLQSQLSSAEINATSLQNQLNSANSQISSLQAQLSNATALIAQLQGPTGVLPTYMDLSYVGPYPSGGAYYLQLSVKNTGPVPITGIFVTLYSQTITMGFTYLNATVSANLPLPSYQTATGRQDVTSTVNSPGVYSLIVQATATNGTIYTYQTTITTNPAPT